MSLKNAIESAQHKETANKRTEENRVLQYEQEQDQLHQKYLQEQKKLLQRLTTVLELHLAQSDLPVLLREAKKLVKGKLSISRGLSSSGVVLVEAYELIWGKEYLIYDNSNNLHRPNLLDYLPNGAASFPDSGCHYWNSVRTRIDSSGLIVINDQKIPVNSWGNNPSILEAALAGAILHPTREDDAPARTPNRNL